MIATADVHRPAHCCSRAANCCSCAAKVGVLPRHMVSFHSVFGRLCVEGCAVDCYCVEGCAVDFSVEGCVQLTVIVESVLAE